MITHRLETQPPTEPAVGFYKIIALSFLGITVVLLAVIMYITSKKATIVIVAKEDSKNIAVNLKVGGSGSQAVPGVVTTTAFYWSEKFEPTGTKTIEGTATGEVTLYNKTATDQTLVKTTRLITPQGVLFRLSDKVTVPANGSVVAAVYADKPGSASEIPPSQFTIPGLAPDKQKVIYASSTKPMAGGVTRVGVLSSDDLKNAQNSYKEKITEAFLASKPNILNGYDKKIITVDELAATSNHQAGEEVSSFTLGGTSTLVVVAYKESDALEKISKALTDATDATTEKFLATSAAPTVAVSGYSLKEGTADLTITQQATVTLDANVDSLAPQHFFGKKKDAIERYVLGLDHVASVDVQFSPGWMLSAPSVPDRIKVIVKNVQ